MNILTYAETVEYVHLWEIYRCGLEIDSASHAFDTLCDFVKLRNNGRVNHAQISLDSRYIEENIEIDVEIIAKLIYHSNTITNEQKIFLKMKWNF